MMIDFIETPASANSLANRRLIFGVGHNDATYTVNANINGIRKQCPYYSVWVNMLRRCYSRVYQAKYKTYIGCTSCTEWHTFSNFKAWMKGQDWKGKDLDKDILFQGNTMYCPVTCIFVIGSINRLLLTSGAVRGEYKIGVNWHKIVKKFQSQLNINGKRTSVGYFDTEQEAYNAYKIEKYKVIKNVAMQQTEPLKSALLNYKINCEVSKKVNKLDNKGEMKDDCNI